MLNELMAFEYRAQSSQKRVQTDSLDEEILVADNDDPGRWNN